MQLPSASALLPAMGVVDPEGGEQPASLAAGVQALQAELLQDLEVCVCVCV